MPRSREELVEALRELQPRAAVLGVSELITEAADLLDSLEEGDGVITTYRRMKAAAEGARAERDIMPPQEREIER